MNDFFVFMMMIVCFIFGVAFLGMGIVNFFDKDWGFKVARLGYDLKVKQKK